MAYKRTIAQGGVQTADNALRVAYGLAGRLDYQIQAVCHRHKIDCPLEILTGLRDVKEWANEAREALREKAV